MSKESSKIKFIVAGQGRCGSNLLKFALKQNPAIEMVGEYFNFNVYPEAREQDGAERAKAFFHSTKGQAVGFKLFIHQATEPPADLVWQSLAEDSDLRVVHLSRRNSFKRNLSLAVAKTRGQWLADERGTDDIVINISPPQWEKRLIRDEESEQRISEMFNKHRKVHIFYEDLVRDWENVTRGIQSFLSVEPIAVSKKLKKQEKMHPSDRCSNYSDLVDHFRGTKFEWMFQPAEPAVS